MQQQQIDLTSNSVAAVGWLFRLELNKNLH